MKKHIPFAIAFGLCAGFFVTLLVSIFIGAINAYVKPMSNSASGDALMYLVGLTAVSALPLLASLIIEIIIFFKDLKGEKMMSVNSMNILFIACIVCGSAFLLQSIWFYIDMFTIKLISDGFDAAILIFSLSFIALALAYAGLAFYIKIVKKKTAQE